MKWRLLIQSKANDLEPAITKNQKVNTRLRFFEMSRFKGNWLPFWRGSWLDRVYVCPRITFNLLIRYFQNETDRVVRSVPSPKKHLSFWLAPRTSNTEWVSEWITMQLPLKGFLLPCLSNWSGRCTCASSMRVCVRTCAGNSTWWSYPECPSWKKAQATHWSLWREKKKKKQSSVLCMNVMLFEGLCPRALRNLTDNGSEKQPWGGPQLKWDHFFR